MFVVSGENQNLNYIIHNSLLIFILHETSKASISRIIPRFSLPPFFTGDWDRQTSLKRAFFSYEPT